jgi:sorbitol-specific phosphotransferase system component IIC
VTDHGALFAVFGSGSSVLRDWMTAAGIAVLFVAGLLLLAFVQVVRTERVERLEREAAKLRHPSRSGVRPGQHVRKAS